MSASRHVPAFDRLNRQIYGDAEYAQLPPEALEALKAIAVYADHFKANEFTAARFVVLTGLELAKLVAE